MNETFRVISDYPNYEINADGIVRSVRTKKIVPRLKRCSPDGLIQVSLTVSFQGYKKQYKETISDLLNSTFEMDELFTLMRTDYGYNYTKT